MKRRKKNFFKSSVLIIASSSCLFGLGVVTSKAVGIDHASLASRQLKPLQNQQQSFYQNQRPFSYQAHTPLQEVALYSKSQGQFPLKNYATRSFFGIQNAWIGKKIFLDGAQPVWSASQKQLEKKVFSTHVAAHASERVTGRAVQTCSYPTRIFYPEAKAQGGLDHDVQKALQQKKSPAEVRGMLEKEF